MKIILKGGSAVLAVNTFLGLLLSCRFFYEFNVVFALTFGSMVTNVFVIVLIALRTNKISKSERRLRKNE